MSEYHAFSERIGQEVALKPLTTEDVNYLIAESVELILQRSQGNIRQILSLYSRALDAAVDRDSTKIDTQLVEMLLS